MSQPIKCRAAILYKEGEPLVIEETIVEAPKNDQLRIKMVAAGICATDGHFIWNKNEHKLEYIHQNLPLVLGHEGSGMVESIGPNVTDFKPGDHVLVTFSPQCKQCDYCKNPLTNLCQIHNWLELGNRINKTIAKSGTGLYGFLGLGTFSEYMLVHKTQVIKISEKVNLENATIISCSVSTGFYSAVNLAKVKPNTTCAIWGIGAIGLNTLQGCKFSGAKNIIAIDINPDKRDLAFQFGCTEFINPKELNCPIEQFLLEKYFGIDYAFDCFGSSIIINQALESLSPYGTFIMVGNPKDETNIVYPAVKLLQGRTIMSGCLGNKKSDEAYQEMVEMYLQKKIKIDELISHKFKLNQINEAFETLKNGKCIRSLITF